VRDEHSLLAAVGSVAAFVGLALVLRLRGRSISRPDHGLD